VKLLTAPHDYSQNGLADEADIPRSTLSRFLEDKTTLAVGSTLKLYPIISHHLGALDGQAFLDATGQSSLVASIMSTGVRPLDRTRGPQVYGEQLSVVC
jgi:hypothetical protein